MVSKILWSDGKIDMGACIDTVKWFVSRCNGFWETDMKGCASVCVVSGGILWDKDHRRRGCAEGRRGGRGAAEVATVVGRVEEGKGGRWWIQFGTPLSSGSLRGTQVQGFWWMDQLSSLLEGLPLCQLAAHSSPVLPFTSCLFQKWIEISNSPMSPLCLWKHFFFFSYCHFDVVDGGKRSADNLLNGARSFKSQYLSRGGEEMEEEGAVAEKKTEQRSGMWL